MASRTAAGAGAILVVTLALPLLASYPAPESALHLSRYSVNLIGQVMCFAVLAMALNLIWGFAGILSLGHGLFFALGGYLMAMHLVKVAYSLTGVLPDFVLFMGWKTLPWYWAPFDSVWLALLVILLVPSLVAFLFGYVSFRSRVTGVYFAIITQALTYVAMLLFFRNDTGFGGNNGMTGFVELIGAPLEEDHAAVGLAFASGIAVFLTFVLCAALARSRVGRVLLAIRDDEARLRFLGYETLRVKLFAFCLSALLAAIAGALYVPQVGIVNPRLMSPEVSLEIAVWVAIGGRGTLAGPIVGAVAINALKFWLAAEVPEAWPFVLSALIVVVALVLPNGLLDLQSKGIPGRIDVRKLLSLGWRRGAA